MAEVCVREEPLWRQKRPPEVERAATLTIPSFYAKLELRRKKEKE